MKLNSKDTLKEIDDFFSSPPTANQKAWGIINHFYHLVLTYMEENNITRADLSKRLGKSRAAISQMFNKTPNISVRKMIEIADALGLEIDITSKQIEDKKGIQKDRASVQTEFVFVPVPVYFSEKTGGELTRYYLDQKLDVFINEFQTHAYLEEQSFA